MCQVHARCGKALGDASLEVPRVSRMCKSTGVVSLHKSMGAASPHKSMGAASLHKSMGAASLHKSVGVASLHKSMGAASLHKSMGDASVHKSMGAASVHKSMGAASLHKSMGAASLHKSVGVASLHKSMGVASLHKSMGAASLYKSMGSASLYKSMGTALDTPSLHKSTSCMMHLFTSQWVLNPCSMDTVFLHKAKYFESLHQFDAAYCIAQCRITHAWQTLALRSFSGQLGALSRDPACIASGVPQASGTERYKSAGGVTARRELVFRSQHGSVCLHFQCNEDAPPSTHICPLCDQQYKGRDL